MGQIQKDQANNIISVLVAFLLLWQNIMAQATYRRKMFLRAYSFRHWVHDHYGGEHGNRQAW